jgi:threonine aldolase
MARRLADGFAEVPGVELLHPVEGNEIFCTLPAALAEGLAAQGFLLHPWGPAGGGEMRLVCAFDWGPAGGGEMRLVCAFDRSEDEVDALLAAARQLASSR